MDTRMDSLGETMTATLTLNDFLLARIAADESFALSAQAAASIYDEGTVRWHWLRTNGTSNMWEPTLHDPARVLAECEAKRKIVDWLTPVALDSEGWYAMRLLALPYANHS